MQMLRTAAIKFTGFHAMSARKKEPGGWGGVEGEGVYHEKSTVTIFADVVRLVQLKGRESITRSHLSR